MRKPRGWEGVEKTTEISVIKPSGISYYFHGSNLFIQWISSIGCVEGYKVYGGKEENAIELLGETNASQYNRKLSENDFPYYISVSAFFQNNESERTQLIRIRENFDNNVIKKNVIENYLPENTKENKYPYGLCSCCNFPQPLMKRKENIVCSGNPKQIYINNSGKYIQKPQVILSDVEQMDELLRQNSAFVGLGGVLVNRRNI